MSVVQKLTILCGLPLVVLAFLVFWSVYLFGQINGGIERVYDDRVIPLVQLKEINDAYSSLVIDAINKAESGLYLPNEALTEVQTAQELIKEKWSHYRQHKLSPEETALAQEAEALFTVADERIEEVVTVLIDMGEEITFDEWGDTPISDYDGDLYEYVEPIALKIRELSKYQINIADKERQHAAALHDSSRRYFVIIALVTAIALIGSAIAVARSISRPLSKLRNTIENAQRNRDLTVRVDDIQEKGEIGQLAQAYGNMMQQFDEIMGSIQTISKDLHVNAHTLLEITTTTREDVSVQTEETDQVATASTQMARGIVEISERAQRAASAASDAKQETGEGTDILNDTIASINSLAEQMQGASEVIHQVETDSSAIGSVLDVIKSIAEQTNLLALNAAIEAARAGEQGRGFAVVADEVRSLAQRTQESTLEIEEMVKGLQLGTHKAVETMEVSTERMVETEKGASKANDSLAAISLSVATISDMNTQIAAGTEQQMTVSQEISENAVNIAGICRRSDDSVQKIETAGQAVDSIVNSLNSMVSEFKISK